MFNFLPTFLADTTSSDGIPGGIASGLDFHAAEFILGLFVGMIAMLAIIGIVKYIKFIIKDNAEMKEKLKSSEKSE